MNRLRASLRSAAFTLVELLVVIMIIAILASLVFPAVNAILRKSYQTTSVSNLRQWYTAFSASVSNHDGELPVDGNSPFDPGNPDAWYNRLPVEMNETAFKDFKPNSTKPEFGKKSVWVNPAVSRKEWAAAGFVFNYGFNDLLVENRDTSAGKRPLHLTTIQSPYLTILMGEKADPFPNLNSTNVRCYSNTSDPVSDLNGKANFLFCDGHIDTITRTDFINVKATDAGYIDTKETNVTWQPYGKSVSKD